MYYFYIEQPIIHSLLFKMSELKSQSSHSRVDSFAISYVSRSTTFTLCHLLAHFPRILINPPVYFKRLHVVGRTKW